MKRVLFGFVWFVVIYLVACMVIGGIAGGIAGSHTENVAMAQQAGRIAGAQAVGENRLLIAAGAFLLAAMGSVAGMLPGTRDRAA